MKKQIISRSFNGISLRNIIIRYLLFQQGLIIIFTMTMLQHRACGQVFSRFQNYVTLSDFPQNSIQYLFQDNKGYMWIGTESGLHLYDGKRIVSYTLGNNNNFNLSSKRINQIAEDADKNIWLATSQGGINIISPFKTPLENKKLQNLSSAINKKSKAEFTGCVMKCRNNTMIIGCDSGICIYRPSKNLISRVLSFAWNGKNHKTDVIEIDQDKEGNIYIASSTEGVFQLDSNFIVRHFYSKGQFTVAAELQILDIICLPEEVMLVATTEGVFRINTLKRSLPKKLNIKADFDYTPVRINCLAYDSLRKVVLLGTNTSGVMILDSMYQLSDHLISNQRNQQLKSNTIYSFWVDKKGLGYWVGTRGGLTKIFLQENLFTTGVCRESEFQTSLPIYPIYTEDNNQLLIGTSTTAFLTNIRTGQTNKLVWDSNNVIRYNCISKISENIYLFGTRFGLLYAANLKSGRLKRFSEKYREIKKYDKFNVLSILKLNENEILIGAKSDEVGGIIRLNLKTGKATHFVNNPSNRYSLTNNTVNKLVRANDSMIIVCTNKGACNYNTRSSLFTPFFNTEKLSLNNQQIMDALPAGNITWLATYGGGLNKYDHTTNTLEYITDKTGLPNNEIYSITKAGNKSDLWLSSNNGIIKFNINNKSFSFFNKTNGLLDNEFNRSSCFVLGDTLYYGGASGYCFFNLAKIVPLGSPPPIEIFKTVMLAEGDEQPIYPASNVIISTHLRNSFKIYLSAPFFINPEKTTFKYRLLPNQAGWISNGTNNELILTQIQSGKHILEVKSISSEGVESFNTKQLYITITPPWYQTLLFKILLGLLISSVLYSFYYLRVNRLRKEQKIRNQFASDLHDDLGSTLNSIKVHSNLAMIEKGKPEHLYYIKQGAQEAINGVRDIVWVLDDKKDSLDDILARINQFAEPLCEVSNVAYNVSANEDALSQRLSKEEKRNLLLIIKESINNSIKYAQCKKITLKAEKNGKNFRIEITDDGIGFNKTKLSGGYGLKNIISRATAIGYKSELITGLGMGTKLILEKA